MYRNSIEKINKFLKRKNILKHFSSEVFKSFKSIAKKCNYMEYLKEKRVSQKALNKGTSSVFTHEGTSERGNSPFMSFETWLYFFRELKQARSLMVSALFQGSPLGYIFGKVVIK